MSLDNILLIPGLGGAKGLLDLYPGAAAAYSLRKVRNDHAGACVRVRRDSDNAEQNIGFVNNFLDTSSLATFCAGANGFITTVYDQTANGYNLTNSNATQQPKIYDSSTGVLTDGSMAAMYNDGTKSMFHQPASFPATGDITFDIFGVATRVSGGINDHIYGICAQSADTDRRTVAIYMDDSGTQRSIRLFGGFTVYDSTFSGRSAINTNYQGGGGAISTVVNGTSLPVSSVSNTGLNIQSASGFKMFGVRTQNGSDTVLTASIGAVAYCQELVFYLSDRSATRAAIQSNQMAYWGII